MQTAEIIAAFDQNIQKETPAASKRRLHTMMNMKSHACQHHKTLLATRTNDNCWNIL